jgi:3-hydroxyisobutyrate dehydrogenase
MPRLAFLGLGDIGTPMAARLARTCELTVWNRTAAKAATFAAEHDVTAAKTVADAVHGAEIVASCLPTSPDVEGLLEGALPALQKGAVWVDFTSGDPAGSRRIAARLATVGVSYLDAPVSGGVAGAEAGTLTIMVGGDGRELERVRGVLDAVGQKIVLCGPIGSGDAVKAVNNALLAVHLWSAGEGLAALKSAGVSPTVALDVINASSGRSNASMNLIPQRVVTRKFPRTFRLALLDKDVGIAAQFIRDQKTPAPVLQLTAELMRIAHNLLGAEADHAESLKVVEQWSGQEIS